MRSRVVPHTSSGKPGDEGGVPRDVEPLLAQLVDAADDHVLHFGGVDLAPLHEGLQRVGQEVVRAGGGESAVSLAHGGARRSHDHCVVHGCLLVEWSRMIRRGGA
jgi:hypothetical protein